ncbi:MAG TPA: hypothetical protein VFF23_01495 [Hanamia sp.]|nr:hypothetical protein [Hanamia sp.]
MKNCGRNGNQEATTNLPTGYQAQLLLGLQRKIMNCPAPMRVSKPSFLKQTSWMENGGLKAKAN